MLMHPHRFLTGAHGGKFRLAHGRERAVSRWPDGVIHGFTRGIPAVLCIRIIPVTEHRRQGDHALAGLCGRRRFGLAVAVKVTVGGEDNLTGRIFLTGKARQRKEVHRRQRHHDGFPGEVMHGERGRVALRYPQPFSRLFFPVENMTRPFHLTAFQGALETVRVNELDVNQFAAIVIQRDNHIPGAVRHAAGFMQGGERQTFPAGEALAGEVGIAGGRAGFLRQFYGQRGGGFAASLRFSVCGRSHRRGNRRQVAGHGVHLPGRL